MDHPKNNHPFLNQTTFKSLKTWLHGNRNDETEETATYSIQENYHKKIFLLSPDEEVDELMQTIRSLCKTTGRKNKPAL